jgi:Effector Associated Constant Component 1
MSDDAGEPLRMVLALEAEPGADPEETERLSRQLRVELLQLDVDGVAAVPDGDAPPRAKGDAVSVAQWLVTLSATGGVFATVIATVRDWLGRRSGAQGIKVTIDGDTLELDRATADERSELIEAFVRRHDGSGP